MMLLSRYMLIALLAMGLLVIPAAMLFLTHSLAWAALTLLLVMMGLAKLLS